MSHYVSVPRRFLVEFLKALDFHGGHGTPSFDRAYAEALHTEATRLLALSATRDSILEQAAKFVEEHWSHGAANVAQGVRNLKGEP